MAKPVSSGRVTFIVLRKEKGKEGGQAEKRIVLRADGRR